MKRTIPIALAALLCGLALGLLLGGGHLSASLTPEGTGNYAPLVMAQANFNTLPATQAPPELDQTDNALLLERAEEVLAALKQADYPTLSTLVHPEKGVTLTPYSTVAADYDRTMTPKEVAALASDTSTYVWGVKDGSGTPIRATCQDYFKRYVYNADYTQAPQIGVDTILMQGNALENAASAYEEGRFVEFHFPGLDPRMEGYDWCSLKLVLEAYGNQWFLVGLIHSEWTV